MRRADWAKGGWQFIFPRGRQRHFFEVSGAEFLPLTELFRCLNGTHTARELGAEFPKHRALIKRFVAFLRTNDLLAPLRRAPPRHPGLEFVSHSSLQFTSDESSVLIDPCFVLPDGQEAISPRDLARFEAKFRQLDQVSAVLLTHSHWDHTHLPTLFRFRRDVPIFVPKVTEETYYNPALAPLLRSLGFTDVREVTPWQPERIGDITFTPVPFYGEWFGPGSHFDAFCYLIELNGVHYLGTVDSERSEAGNMDQVFKELRERVGHSIDCVFFCSSSQTHANPVTCGAPAQYSNGFGIHADLMRYHPNTDAIVRWSRMLKPRVVIPYAEFIFSSTAGRAPINLRAVNAQSHFRDYWRQVESGRLKRLPGVLEWKRDLSRLMPRLPKSTQLVMMSPGERVEA